MVFLQQLINVASLAGFLVFFPALPLQGCSD